MEEHCHLFTKCNRVRSIRSRLRSIMAARQRHLLVLAVDGIPFDFVSSRWNSGQIEKLCSEFPSTSSTSWLSATTGAAPTFHGAVGYYQRFDVKKPAENIFSSNLEGNFPLLETVFTDAVKTGHSPICFESDFLHIPGRWRDAALSGAHLREFGPFYSTTTGFPSPKSVVERLQTAVSEIFSSRQPVFLWCYIDVDLYIHKNGYDDHVGELIDRVEAFACSLSSLADVVVCSDHGLVPTRHSGKLESILSNLCAEFDAELAGAGRVRWFHLADSNLENFKTALTERLPADISVYDREDLFEDGPFLKRVGNPVIVANGEEFLTSSDYCYDHGSCLSSELFVPFVHWKFQGS